MFPILCDSGGPSPSRDSLSIMLQRILCDDGYASFLLLQEMMGSATHPPPSSICKYIYIYAFFLPLR